MALTTIAVASLAVNAYGAYSQNQAGKRMAALGRRQANRQEYYDARLRDLLDNPASIFEDPGYVEASRQGQQAVERSSSAQGFTGSGNAAIALQRFGQSFAHDYLRQQQQLFASMSGANVNPAQAMGAGAQMQAGAYDRLGDSLASLGYTMGSGGGSGYPTSGFGASTSVPGTMEGSGGYIFNIPEG